MLSIAEQTRKRKYNGELRVPLLMDLKHGDVKVGQRYYSHDEFLCREAWMWRCLARAEIMEIRRRPGSSGNDVNWVNTRYLLPGGQRCVHQSVDHTLRSLNRDCLPIPSERLMVFNGLWLPEDLMLEVMMLLGLDKGDIREVKPRKVRIKRSRVRRSDSRDSDESHDQQEFY